MKTVKKAFITVLVISLIGLSAVFSDNVKTNSRNLRDIGWAIFEKTKETFDEIGNITVKEYERKIGLFNEGETEPFAVIDIPVLTLPEADKEALKNGFKIASDKISDIIEDFSG